LLRRGVDLGVLAPFDMNRVKNVGNLIPSMLEGSTSVWTWGDGLYHLPHRAQKVRFRAHFRR
jgi:hypothetical protein